MSVRIPSTPLFSATGPHPYGVDQGSIGDCYFLASCAAAAEYGKRVQDAFITKSMTKEGIIVIKANILGLATPIYVDDYLPFRSKTSKYLSFAGTGDDNALWMAFMEKAWAKANGNY